jgi:hypothetical protein
MTQPASPPPPANPPPGGQPMSVEMPANLEAIYTNMAVLTHSPSEVIIDFARAMPNMKARIQTRVVMTPLNAKLLLRALTENLAKFEETYGEIAVPTHLADHLFRPPKIE